MSSVHSKESMWGRCLYTASKGGINALMRALAIELGAYKIRANCIIAGAIRTDRWDGFTEQEIAQKRKNWPAGLESTGEDIANGVFYLGTDLSKTVTGTELTIDSGVLVSLLPFNGGER
ncbi:MAG: SDR family oxidoreductase [Clostridia bacterium]|nr:SDR family oxidoreductase [Clostridia bacterium]